MVLTKKSPMDWLTSCTRPCNLVASTLLVKNRLIIPLHLMCCASAAIRSQSLHDDEIKGQREGNVCSLAQRVDTLFHVIGQLLVLQK